MPEERPLTPRQRSAIEYVAAGLTHAQAGIKAGYSPNGVKVSMSKMLTKANSSEYLDSLLDKATEIATERVVGHIMSIQERQVWLTRAVLTPLDEIDAGSDLCTESITSENIVKLKKVDQVRAMDMLNKMTKGYTPEEVNHNHTFFDNVPKNNGLGRS